MNPNMSKLSEFDGIERKIIEVDLSSFEKISGTAAGGSGGDSGEIVKFSTEDFSDDLIGDDEIPF